VLLFPVTECLANCTMQDIMEVITKEDGSTDASLAQICVIEDLMEVSFDY